MPDFPQHSNEAERLQFLREWNATDAEFPGACVHQLFEQQVARDPEAVAVVFDGRTLSYRELNRRANQLARCLRDHGVGPDVPVGIYLERSLEMVVGLLAILKSGGAYVPLDPSYPEQRLAGIMEDAAAAVLLTGERLKGRLLAQKARLISIDGMGEEIAGYDDGNLPAVGAADDLAYVIFTSGSTGRPKGVAVTHRALANLLQSMGQAPGLSASDIVLAITPLSFDIAGLELYLPLIKGARVTLLSRDESLDGPRLLARLASSGATVMQATPATWRLLIDAGWEGTPGLKALCGGEALTRDLADKLLRRTAETWNLYGPTETTIWSSAWRVEPGDGVISIGRPIANTQLWVVDADFVPLPVGEVGELCIGGVGVARGYWARPELTAQKFVPDPFSAVAGARLFRTGDLARWLPDGRLECLGRIDHQVKIRGFRIEPGEIESTIARHPAVHAVVVVAREDQPGDKRLVAYLAVRNSPPDLVGQLRTLIREALPEYMLPAGFVILDTLPLTHNGKIDRQALPAPCYADLAVADHFVAPRTDVEQALATIWCDLFKLERVGIEDNFFDLGGHSLLAMRALMRIRDAFGADLQIQSLFANPTISALSAFLGTAGSCHGNAPQIAQRKNGGPCPLSFAQEHLWLMDRLAPGNPVYNIVDVILFTGHYDAPALRRALDELLRRHEMLRTIFAEEDGQAIQIVLPTIDVVLSERDLSSLPAREQEAEWQSMVHAQGQKAFVLAQGPLLRWVMVHLSDQEHRLLLNIHHIIADEWGMDLIQQEVRQLYEAFSLDREPSLAELPIQYADFACWQREHWQDEARQKQMAYWKEALAGAPTILELPTDKPRPAVQSFRGATERFAVDKALSGQLKALGRQEQATLFMVLEACFAVLLYRYTGQDDLLVGTPISGRRQSETERLIGYFLNIHVLRTRFSAGMSFRSLLRQMREQALAAYAHAGLPFQQLVAELAPVRDPGRSPLFQVMFVLHDPAGMAQVSGTSGHREQDIGAAGFDLTLSFSENDDGLEGIFEYSTDLFEKETIRRMCGHCGVLLAAIVRNPDQRVDVLPLLTEAERHQILFEWNDTAVDYPADVLLHGLFEAQAARTPEAPAVVFEDRSLSYRELDARSNQLAHFLQKRGVGPDSFVAICVERSLEMAVALLGILKAGGAYVPIDPDYPRQRMATMLDELHPPVVLTQQHLRERLPIDAGPVLCLDSGWPTIAGEPATPAASPVTPQHIAYVIYTSGSTGRPKGIMISHAAICNHLFWMQRTYPIHREDAVLQKTSYGFDPAVWEFFAPLVAGARLVMARPGGHMDPAYLAQLILEYPIRILQVVPSLLRMLLDEPAFCFSTSPLRDVISGGEPLASELCEAFHQRLPQVRLSNSYGPSETTIDATTWDWPAAATPADDALAVIPIGRPIDNTRAYIANAQLQLAPIGVPGELLIGGRGLARGYINQPELTADRFIADPFCKEPGARVYKTGDLVRYLPDGNIEFLGRLDHQVKIRGFRIELGEIESCIARHPAVREVVVIACGSISENKRLVAYLVAENPPADLDEQLRTQIRRALPEYMLPSSFVLLDALPLNRSGKIDRQALPEPRLDDAARAARAVGPRTPSERLILGIFHEVLGRTDFGVLDSFFDLGGHSIMAAQLVFRLQEKSRLNLPLRYLFEQPTVAGLAEIVDGLSWLAKAKAPAAGVPNREEFVL